MKTTFLLLVFFLTAPLAPKAQAQTPHILPDNCDSYYVIEDSLRCGPQSYIKKFALPYCQKYLEQNHLFSEPGQKVLRRIRSCLQEEMMTTLLTDSELSCQNIRSIGIHSHYKCYLEAGFCNLNNRDLILVMWIAKSKVLDSEIMRTFFAVIQTCQKQTIY